MAAVVETFVSTPVAAITLIDHFIQLRGSNGKFPPPLGAVAFELIAALPIGGPVPLDPPIMLAARTNGGGIHLFSGEGTAGDGPALRIPAARYRLLIASDYYQAATLDVDWPPSLAAPPTILLDPAAAYPFPDLTMVSNQLTLLSGNLYSIGDRTPIAGALVRLTAPANNWPFASCTSDANGGWVIVMPLGTGAAAFNATLHFAPPNAAAFDVAAIPVQPGAANSLPQTAIRGAVVLTTNGAPIAGASITIAGVQGACRSARDGTWSFYFDLNQPDVQAQVTATAPSGRNQSQNVQIRNRVTVLVPAFQIAPN